MNRLYILVLVGVLIFSNAFAGKNDDHSSVSSHSDDDGHNHKKKKHDHSKGHDDHSEDHDNHEGHDGHGGGKAIGKGKAIEAVDKVKGFKLSREAIKTLKLKLQTVDGDEFTIQKTTLVASKGSKGLYRFREGFFKFLPVKIIKEVSNKYLVKVKGVDFGDQIVTNGVGLLRVSDVYSTDKSEYGHSH
jgi:hypothetical protein